MKRKTFIYSVIAVLFLVTCFAFTYASLDDDKQVMTIIYDTYQKTIFIDTPSETKEIKPDKLSYGDLKKVLGIVSDYKKQGWSVKSSNMTIRVNSECYYFYLEK